MVDILIQFRFTQVSGWKIFSFMQLLSFYFGIVQDMLYKLK